MRLRLIKKTQILLLLEAHPFLTTKPRKTNPPGLVFVCCCSSQRSNRRTLFHYFSINTDRLFTLTGYLIRYHHAVNLNLLIINSFLFYDCFNSGFTFYGYYNYTGRCRDFSLIRRDHCASNSLTKYVADNNFLALSTVDDNSTFFCNYRD